MKQAPNSNLQNVRDDFSFSSGPQELFEKQAAKAPDAGAVSMGSKELSYRELNERANRLAHFLQKRSVRPNQIVGVLLDRSVEMIVCLLGILKAGAVYLPLDPKFPTDRLAFMLSDAEVSILLTQAEQRGNLPPTTAEIVVLEEAAGELEELSAEDPKPVNRPEDAAYVIYTSGSTGRPKGVMVPRRALVNFLLSVAEEPGIATRDTLLAITTISFDISLLEMLLPLTVGATVVIATRAQAADPFDLRKLLDEHHVTVMQATPTTWRLLVESGWEGKPDLKILCGGEALTADLAERLLPRCRELWNMYGPTETTIWSSTERVRSPQSITLGKPIANTLFVVVDEQLRPVPVGATGELLIGGDGLALGYLKRDELTAQKFIPDTINGIENTKLYRTGDEVRWRADHTLEFLGRLDHQVKLNGFRIELGEIENALAHTEGIRQGVVILREDVPGDKRLVAYYTGEKDLDTNAVLQSLRARLPEYMVPSAFVWMAEFPQTPNAKLDRKALPVPARKRPQLAQEYIAPSSDAEKQMAALWQELLRIDRIGIDDSFFDLGGNSIAVFRMVSAYRSRCQREIPPVKVFQYPTIAQLCQFLAQSDGSPSIVADAQARVRGRGRQDAQAREPVAVIGMVGRFPGADNLEQLWRNLCESRESISFFTPEELGPGIDERLRTASDYIRARGILEGAELFDAGFFGISPLEAKVMDPQQRVFLELAYNALENAGYDPNRYRGLIGVYAGIGDNHYYTTNLLTHPDLLARAGKLAVEYGNQKDYIALRTAYLLDLRGPAVSLNTACSTTLLAVDLAYRSLLDHECDMALAGGIDITVPQKSGFLYTEGGTFARDGHCRPFDADATGTMFCDGAGIVVLKRLSDALRDGDTIHAVLLGTGKNNNGARPASFLAPSVEGQAEAVAMAQADAGINVEDIGYIEAHGTGTPVGDPIEVQALNSVFAQKTQKKQYCYIGSLKGNVGHPTNAAGVAGFIKAAMVLEREEIPPTLHYKTPNPRINFADSPFVVADRLIPYRRGPQPRYTAVSSFGFGGTNVHAILREAPAPTPGSASRLMQLLPVSARTSGALDALSASLAGYFQNSSADHFADAAFTLQTGRKQMAWRRIVVAADPAEASHLLQQPDPRRCAARRCERRDPPVAFLFGGQGTQYVNMGRNLYAGEPLFRAVVDDCCEILKPHLGRDLRELLYPNPGDNETASISLQDTFFTQPSLFVIEYALARFWQSLGIQPAIMAGHSIGEFVAATLADVWDLEDVLRIVALRGRLMQDLPRGTMMAVRTGADAVARLLPPDVQIASNNAPSLCVVSGPDAPVQAFRAQLEAQGILCRPLYTSHAFHSAMMDPMIEPLRAEIARVHLRAPARTVVSTVTGQVLTEAEMTSPDYWAHQARATVEFSRAAFKLKELGHTLFLECGPRATLCALVRQHFSPAEGCVAIPTLADTHEDNQEWASMLFALGSLWLNGVSVDWDAFYANEDRRRIPLPAYPFERQRYWVDPAQAVPASATAQATEPVEVAAASSSPAPADTATPAASRKDRLVASLIQLVAPISGHESGALSSSTLFVEQGFDSLSLAQVSVEIEREFGVKLGFSKLMNEFPAVEMVAAHLDKILPADVLAAAPPRAEAPRPASTPAASLPAASADPSVQALAAAVAEQGRILASIQAALEKIAVPVSPAAPQAPAAPAPAGRVTVPTTIPQRGIFYSSQLSQNLSGSYNESITLSIRGQISVPKIRRSLERLVERHDALRAAFDPSGSTMHIESRGKLEVPVQQLSAGSAPELEQKLKQLALEEAAHPFSLPAGPFWRATIVLHGSDAASVILTVHHIICDGWSIDVLIQDFCAFYSEELSGPGTVLPPAPSFADYARQSDRRAHSHEFEVARDYWVRKFARGLPALSLPTDLPRQPVRQHRAIRIDRTIGPELVERLRRLAAEQGCSLFAVVVSALSILLARLSRQSKFALALSTAEQPFLGQTNLVGHCVSLMPFLVDLRAEEDATALVRRVQKDLAEAMDYLAYTSVSLMEEIVSSSRVRTSPIPVGLTGVKKFRPEELDQRGFSLDYVANPKSFESFEWYLSAMESTEGLEVHGHYDVELFRQETIAQWLADYEAILAEIASEPGKNTFALAHLTELATADQAAPGTDSKEELTYYLVSSNHAPGAAAPLNGNGNLASVSLPSDSAASSAPDTPDDSLDEVTQTLMQVWTRVLNLRQVGINENFFALGGNSLLAVRLMNEVERLYKVRLPLATLFQAPSVAEMASVLRRNQPSSSWSSLAPINSSGSRIPLFLMHAHGGNTLEYHALARLLGADQPVYALQARGLDGHIHTNASIEEMAAAYLGEIRSLRPDGPYLIGGFCFGGLLALEVAQQLRSVGQEVPLLVLIQAAHPRANQFKPNVSKPRRIWYSSRKRINLELENLAFRGVGYFGERIRYTIDHLSAKAAFGLGRIDAGRNPDLSRLPMHYILEALAIEHTKAALRYTPSPYDGDVVLLRASKQLQGLDSDEYLGWKQIFTGKFDVIEVPGHQQNLLLYPHVSLLAVQLSRELDRVAHAVQAQESPYAGCEAIANSELV